MWEEEGVEKYIHKKGRGREREKENEIVCSKEIANEEKGSEENLQKTN